MEKLAQYRQLFKAILTEYSSHKPAYGEVQGELIFDDERNRYQLVYAGWNKHRRIYASSIHIDLKDDKIWIQNDGTEDVIANILIERGVPHQDIVLAYQSPFMRKFTDFAVG